MKPYFSVVTPSFNQGEFIETCIRSVLDQHDGDFEHIIIDNCSTDETPTVLARHPHLKATVEPDRGQSDAINKGFLQASGEIICWLNADDAYPAGLFKRLRELFSDREKQVVFGDVTQIAYDGTAPQRAPGKFKKREDLIRWWSSDVRLHQPAIFFRREAMLRTGKIREDLHMIMDYEYWWRMSERHVFHYVPEVLALQYRQPASKTIVQWNKVYVEREKIFSAFYDLIAEGDIPALLREKRRAMADRYLSQAYAQASLHPQAAWADFRRALAESPVRVLHPRSLGLLRRLLTSKTA